MPPAGSCGLPTSARNRSRPAVCRRPFRRATDGVRALLHGDANCTGAAPPHPQRSALPLLSRRSARGLAAAQRRRDQARRRRTELARRGTAAALHPGNTFHTARLTGRGRWFLGASTEWPGGVPADVETGNVEEMAAKFPSIAADLR